MSLSSNNNPREKLNTFGSEARPESAAPESQPQSAVEAERAPVEVNASKANQADKKRFSAPKGLAKVSPVAPAVSQDQKTFEIKSVLGKGLGGVYSKMDSQHQAEFLNAEEKAAVKIKEVLAKEPVKSRKIFNIIFDWLKNIPVVNKFFLKQEAKIKTDQIVELDKKR